MAQNFTPAQRISLKLHPELNERWVQDLIKADPSILGLGDLLFLTKEKMQPHAGRLDLLLEDADPEAERRYSHIIRTIEYWDIERRRYPQYDHCAVIVAEDITSRFLNVISLFNGALPLIALQMQALKVGEHITLIFTKVMDELKRGPDDGPEPPPVDRKYWEEKGSKATVQLADELLGMAREIDPLLEPQYNKHYIGIYKEGHPFNFCIFRPQKKNTIVMAIRLPRSDEINKKIEDAGIEQLTYAKYGAYRMSLEQEDITKQRELLKQLMQAAYQIWST